ncbi:MAG TPA: hypothetical protein VLD61_05365, partial [Methylomirabilota bacterium]|nr:hypothetical protein [Methylomirabilota bacterium]
MRTLTLAAAALVAAVPATAQQGAPSQLPAGWQARADKDAPIEGVKFVTMAGGVHATTGPAVILWRPGDQGQGDFAVAASFTQTKAPEHPEAYGLFVGGRALQSPEQHYTYFLVRGDGKFLIKTRTGATTANVTAAWAEHPAVVKADAAGKASNTLRIERAGDRVRFLVNGTEVHSAAAADVATG